MNKKTIVAYFQPQAWIDDCAVDIDGAYNFDVTDLVKKMGRKKALQISDGSADNLWVSDHPDKDHDGPFSVTVEVAIRDYFK